MVSRCPARSGVAAIVLGLAVVLAAASTSSAQSNRRDRDDESRMTDYGVRFTPEMARGFARLWMKGFAARRYDMDEEAVEEATELAARRFMEAAHKLDDEGYREVLEEMVNRMVRSEVEQDPSENINGIHPDVGQAMGEGLLPMLPRFREALNGIARDVRPMLAPGQQLKFAGDMMAFQTAIDSFEKTMERWSEGDVRPGEDPFIGRTASNEKDEEGRTRAYRQARKEAEKAINSGRWDKWEEYVEEAKQFYNLDYSQASTADSILRECLDRVQAVVQSDYWRSRMFRNRFWSQISKELRVDGRHPMARHLASHYSQMFDPIVDIERDLKRRIDAIPTQVQRQQAEERVLETLVGKGYREKMFRDPVLAWEAAQQRDQASPTTQGHRDEPTPPAADAPRSADKAASEGS